MVLLRLVTLSISLRRYLDTVPNKLYDRVHRLKEAALLNSCYTQHAFHPHSDSEINHI